MTTQVKGRSKDYEPIVEKKWVSNGLDCKVVFNSHWRCGYVRVPKENILFNINYDDVPIEVHGGLTYGSNNKNDEFWLGFDCAHYTDKNADELEREGHYWTLEDTVKETEKLAEQITKVTLRDMIEYKLRYMPDWFKHGVIIK